jgi:hypothetical protein
MELPPDGTLEDDGPPLPWRMPIPLPSRRHRVSIPSRRHRVSIPSRRRRASIPSCRRRVSIPSRRRRVSIPSRRASPTGCTSMPPGHRACHAAGEGQGSAPVSGVRCPVSGVCRAARTCTLPDSAAPNPGTTSCARCVVTESQVYAPNPYTDSAPLTPRDSTRRQSTPRTTAPRRAPRAHHAARLPIHARHSP